MIAQSDFNVRPEPELVDQWGRFQVTTEVKLVRIYGDTYTGTRRLCRRRHGYTPQHQSHNYQPAPSKCRHQDIRLSRIERSIEATRDAATRGSRGGSRSHHEGEQEAISKFSRPLRRSLKRATARTRGLNNRSKAISERMKRCWPNAERRATK